MSSFTVAVVWAVMPPRSREPVQHRHRADPIGLEVGLNVTIQVGWSEGWCRVLDRGVTLV